MQRRSLLLVVFLLISSSWTAARADTFGSGANSFDIEFVPIGNPGNPADSTGAPRPAGAVPYIYRMGKYEISEQMIAKANALGVLGITKDARGPDKPATGITWFEAAKFVNWLNTSTGHTRAYKFDGTGTFQLWLPSDLGYDSNNRFRNSRARYFLPSADEWYKAAYYDPLAGVYYNYPTGSNSVPDGLDSAGDPNFDAVFNDNGGNLQPNNITDVGVMSPYGSAGQGGNVSEWNETDVNANSPDISGRIYRGGTWGNISNNLLSTSLISVIPSSGFLSVGFRVASVPEPATRLLIGSAILGMFGGCRLFVRTNTLRSTQHARFNNSL